MAYHRNITSADQVFFDTDRVFEYTLYEAAPDLDAQIAAGTAVPEDVTGWALSWVLRKKVNSTEILIEKIVGEGIEIVGTYNASMALNTQRIRVTLAATDTYNVLVSPPVTIKAGKYQYALKRTDDGAEDIKAYGSFQLLQAAAWEIG